LNSIVPLIKRRITYRQWSIYKILWFNNCWSLSQQQPVSIYNNFWRIDLYRVLGQTKASIMLLAVELSGKKLPNKNKHI